jgi:hypothetical protein
VQLIGGTKSVNRDLEAKARTLAGFRDRLKLEAG